MTSADSPAPGSPPTAPRRNLLPRGNVKPSPVGVEAEAAQIAQVTNRAITPDRIAASSSHLDPSPWSPNPPGPSPCSERPRTSRADAAVEALSERAAAIENRSKSAPENESEASPPRSSARAHQSGSASARAASRPKFPGSAVGALTIGRVSRVTSLAVSDPGATRVDSAPSRSRQVPRHGPTWSRNSKTRSSPSLETLRRRKALRAANSIALADDDDDVAADANASGRAWKVPPPRRLPIQTWTTRKMISMRHTPRP